MSSSVKPDASLEEARPDRGTWFDRVDGYVRTWTPFTPVVGLARTLIAGTLLLTLLLTPMHSLFFTSANYPDGVVCNGGPVSSLSLFCIAADGGWLEASRWIAVAILLLVMTGLRPALTGVPHWYVTWSFAVSSNAVDGGDQLAANLVLLLVGISLLDRRRNHWKRDVSYSSREPWAQYLAYLMLVLWVLQLIGVYFQASVAKMAVPEWADGSALWYWMQNPAFAPAEPLQGFVLGILQFPMLAVLGSYATLALQLFLCVAPFLGLRTRVIAFFTAAVFHGAIAVGMGLWSFSLVMIGADFLFLSRPHEDVHIRLRRSAWRVR